jgi:hypothetical protein
VNTETLRYYERCRPDGHPMRLEVLHVPDCPHLAPLLVRLREVTDLPITTRVIDSDAEAAQFGMAGSPTLLIDGVDPFAVHQAIAHLHHDRLLAALRCGLVAGFGDDGDGVEDGDFAASEPE